MSKNREVERIVFRLKEPRTIKGIDGKSHIIPKHTVVGAVVFNENGTIDVQEDKKNNYESVVVYKDEK